MACTTLQSTMQLSARSSVQPCTRTYLRSENCRQAQLVRGLPRLARAGRQGVLARSYKKGTTTEDVNRAAQKDLGIDTDELNAKFNSYVEKDKWEDTDEKPAVVAIAVAVFIGIWATSGLVDRIDRLPVVGGLLEFVGLLVTGWFVYRYLLFGPDREELKNNLKSFVNKVTGEKSF